MKNILIAAFIITTSSSLFAQASEPPKRDGLNLTIYNSNLGVVRDVRLFDLKKGMSEIKLQDISAQLDPTTVKITSPKHPGQINLIEQNYQYDLVNQATLLQKYIDKKVVVTDDKRNVTEGVLLSAEGNFLTLQTSSGIVMLTGNSSQISVPTLPEGLLTRPTLVWQLASNGGYTNEPLEVTYQSTGLNWHAEYIVALADDDKSLDLSGWVSLENNSGVTYPDAHLKVVAGSIHRAQRPQQYETRAYAKAGMADMAAPEQFEERGMFEYHLYDLGRTTTLHNNEVKQISLLNTTGVRSEKVYTYNGGRNVEVSINFKNLKENNMGMPLPEGVIRVMKRDKDGSLEFVGEDRIHHTPRDEEISLKVGDAFDILGERTVTDSRNLGGHSSSESVEVNLKNRKDEDVIIDVTENVGYSWDITKSSIPFDKKNASTIIFHVPVKARSEKKLSYTVIHTW